MKFLFKHIEFIFEKGKTRELIDYLLKEYKGDISILGRSQIIPIPFVGALFEYLIIQVETSKRILKRCKKCGYPINKKDLLQIKLEEGIFKKHILFRYLCKCCDNEISKKIIK